MNKSFSFKDYINNQLYPLGVRLFFLIFLYSFLRLLFVVANSNNFQNINSSLFFYGLRFDLSAIFFSNVLYVAAALIPFSIFYKKIYQKICNLYFIIINSIAALFAYIDIAYYPYILKRMTCDIFSYLQIGFDFKVLLPSFLKQFWYLLLLFLATLFIIIYIVHFTNKMISKKTVFQPFSWKSFFYKTLVFLAVVFISFLCMRGGFQKRAIGLIDSGKYSSVQNSAIISNTPFSIMKTIGEKHLPEKLYFIDLDEAERHFSPIINSIIPYSQNCFPVKNVIIIILEGFSQYLIKGMDGDQGYAPFLDSLLHQSISFNGIANSHRTIDALQAIFTGLPKLLEKSYIETRFADNFSSSPVEVLKKHGFNTLFFHGAKNSSMNIESYCYSIGFDTYYGKNEYPNSSDYDGVWGISDLSFLKFVAQKLGVVRQPFFAGVLTLSSHNPFVMPKDAENLELKSGPRPIHALASYTDHAVSVFFETVSQNQWYDSTLFIITGDHIGEGSFPTPCSIYTTLQIPIFFFHPAADFSRKMGSMQQLDIMPSLFAYLHIDEPLFSYGKNIFDSTYTLYSANYTWGIYQLVTESYVLQFDGENAIGLFDIKKDLLMQHNLISELPEVAALYEQKLKAILQSYTTRLIKNQLFLSSTF